MPDQSSSETFEEAKLRYELMNNVNADHRLIGGPALLCPQMDKNASQRMSMYISNTVQALIANGAEIPSMASGYEREFMKYTFNSTRTTQGGTTVACIPKFRQNVGKSPIRFNPSSILIYIGEQDGQVHYMDIPRYIKCTDGFGYENVIKENFLRAGVGIPANFEIAHSKAIRGSQYGFGVNANIAYMSMKETSEDAFCMSQSLADKLGSTGIKTLVLSIDKNMIPLNLYGTSDEYKFMPDIHENVREDGLLCAFRKVNEASMISDMTDQSLMIHQVQHDELCFAVEPDAVVIDVDIYKNSNRQIKTPAHIFSQADKYIENSLYFHRQILQVYEKECVKAGRQPSPAFVSLVGRAAEILAANKEKNLGVKTHPKFTLKGEAIKFLYMAITYKYSNKVSKGGKSTGREGAHTV